MPHQGIHFKPTAFIRDLANRIREYCREPQNSQAKQLPSITDFSNMLRVSRPSVLAAAHLLRSEGFLEFHQGKRMSLVRPRPYAEPLPVPPKTSGSVALESQLSQALGDGTHPWGERIPKRFHYARAHGISTATVSRVFHRLMERGLLHRRGREFIAGPQPASQQAPHGTPGPGLAPLTVMVFTRDADARSWTHMCSSGREAPFGQAFVSQASRYGVRLVHVSASPTTLSTVQNSAAGPADSALGIAAHRNRIRQTIGKLDSVFLGVLLACKASEMDPWAEWSDFFLGFGKPVIWFDRAGEGLRREPALAKKRKTSRASRLRHFKFDEAPFAETAVAYLHGFGHRRVYMPMMEATGWQGDRLRQMRQAGAALSPSLEVEGGVAFVEDDWLHPERPQFQAVLRSAYGLKFPGVRARFERFERFQSFAPGLRTPGYPPAAGFIAYSRLRVLDPGNPVLSDLELEQDAHFLWDIIRLTPVLSSGSYTALVAPNDWHAGLYLRRLEQLGVVVPKGLSLLAFDNTARYRFSSITSVDPGFAALGHQALQAFLSATDAQFMGRRQGAVIKPFVVDRGSVGPPRPGVKSQAFASQRKP